MLLGHDSKVIGKTLKISTLTGEKRKNTLRPSHLSLLSASFLCYYGDPLPSGDVPGTIWCFPVRTYCYPANPHTCTCTLRLFSCYCVTYCYLVTFLSAIDRPANLCFLVTQLLYLSLCHFFYVYLFPACLLLEPVKINKNQYIIELKRSFKSCYSVTRATAPAGEKTPPNKTNQFLTYSHLSLLTLLNP